MRKGIIILFILLPLAGISQHLPAANHFSVSENKTDHYINLFLRTDQAPATSDKFATFIKKLGEKKSDFKNDHEFLRYLFNKTHQKFLRHYTAYCSFNAMLADGTYNCLTGTSLYALLLDHFGFEYEITETSYHIFLMAHTSKGIVLFEATDPINGFIESLAEIERRIARYKQNEIQQLTSGKIYYHFQTDVYNTVGLDELLGLMYYNLSIIAYNKHEFGTCINYLDQAVRLYQSSRIEEFSKIILLTLAAKDLNSAEKQICIKRIQTLRKKMPALASKVAIP